MNALNPGSHAKPSPAQTLGQEAQALLTEIISVEFARKEIQQQALNNAQVLALTHVLCLSGRAAQCAASRAILEVDTRMMSKRFVVACTTRSTEFRDVLKRKIIHTSGINHYFAQSVKGSPTEHTVTENLTHKTT